jgi:hypothetical protein
MKHILFNQATRITLWKIYFNGLMLGWQNALRLLILMWVYMSISRCSLRLSSIKTVLMMFVKATVILEVGHTFAWQSVNSQQI